VKALLALYGLKVLRRIIESFETAAGPLYSCVTLENLFVGGLVCVLFCQAFRHCMLPSQCPMAEPCECPPWCIPPPHMSWQSVTKAQHLIADSGGVECVVQAISFVNLHRDLGGLADRMLYEAVSLGNALLLGDGTLVGEVVSACKAGCLLVGTGSAPLWGVGMGMGVRTSRWRFRVSSHPIPPPHRSCAFPWLCLPLPGVLSRCALSLSNIYATMPQCLSSPCW
jgi:hypothetical protein